ncbi:hypothetical protein VTK73DRAFT_2196 [Phialemonium thermophilum]|uniref:Kinesin motor domain-containing protein n=1 Tax=Phialemonium thermophilum TaxID=223376 RepID=A0ABR3Y2B3_9PEZI
MGSASRSGAFQRASTRSSSRASTAKQGLVRQATAASRMDRNGAISPAESLSSTTTAGAKRKEREFDGDHGESTNINVVVRCRGRNEREVRENSAVVVRTEGVKGQIVDLSMGPNALSNKTYNFDRVFSPAADQSMLFDEVVKPILDEMLAGYNCTIFAYGQTGTGKTYTMSGDMNDTFGLLSDAAGIIPRVLHTLFNKLEIDDTENCVRCSFIELYNEELRDLLSPDDGTKLKIFDDNSRKGHAATVVQGMEERHITSATEGLKWLQEGSVRRQVAATKCNDLSSRSHTVFTITVHAKRRAENGEDYLSVGKLNLVDLAGSENIQRSGAENKRAAEAGLINKSLLTLGRVINALVDRSAHIPYRESKLTRLLQDSLGGRTKTCIIATISPAKSNLEETISTLDYAFRAKNIRNKPQINAMINKKMLLREFSTEIEKLKSELIATRQRNGVYLSNEAYEELTVQNESRRILTEEQAAKIETLETNLRNKVQELFSLTSSFMGLKKEHESTRALLDNTKGVLDQTELVLAATRKTLAEETHMRKAHQETEEKLTEVGGELINTLKQTVGDVTGLHAKNKRKSELQNLNRSTWGMSQSHVSSVTELVEGRIQEFRKGQEQNISSVSDRMQRFVREELEKLSSTQAFLDENLNHFGKSHQNLIDGQSKSKEEMDKVLGEIEEVRDNIKTRVGQSLEAITVAAERIAADVVSELNNFHNQLHSSYSSLGKDFKTLFEELCRQINSQKAESDRLRRQLESATDVIMRSNQSISEQVQEALAQEREQAAEERQQLLSQITTLITSQAELQESRIAGKTSLIQKSFAESNKAFRGSVTQYSVGMDTWNAKGNELLDEISSTKSILKKKLKDDWNTANDHSTSIRNKAQSVHIEAIRLVEEQKKYLDTQMMDLDDFLTHAKSENEQHHSQHVTSLQGLSEVVEQSFADIATHFTGTFDRVRDLGDEMEASSRTLSGQLEPLEENICRPLSNLREDINNTVLREYEPTGDTPQKVVYQFPTELPRTNPPEVLLAELKDSSTPTKSPPSVFSDADATMVGAFKRSPSASSSPKEQPRLRALSMCSNMSLREVNPNLTTGTILFDPAASTMSMPAIDENTTMPLLKKRTRGSAIVKQTVTRYGAKRHAQNLATMAVLEGRENIPPEVAFSQSTGPRRKSPRLH